MSDRIHEYKGKGITVSWDSKRCVHVAECIRRLRSVFDTTRVPWVQPDNADAERVAEVVQRCPTGALHFNRMDGQNQEAIPAENSVEVSTDGPLYLRGDIEIKGADETVILKDTRVALCRCGASASKPFCDGKHRQINFHGNSRQLPDVSPEKSSDAATGKLTVNLRPNGSLKFQGNFKVRLSGSDNGKYLKDLSFCRCGKSERKPFCDGTHKKFDFKTA